MENLSKWSSKTTTNEEKMPSKYLLIQQRMLQLWKNGTFCTLVPLSSTKWYILTKIEGGRGYRRHSRSRSQSDSYDRHKKRRRHRSRSSNSDRSDRRRRSRTPKEKKDRKNRSRDREEKHKKKHRRRDSSNSS